MNPENASVTPMLDRLMSVLDDLSRLEVTVNALSQEEFGKLWQEIATFKLWERPEWLEFKIELDEIVVCVVLAYQNPSLEELDALLQSSYLFRLFARVDASILTIKRHLGECYARQFSNLSRDARREEVQKRIRTWLPFEACFKLDTDEAELMHSSLIYTRAQSTLLCIITRHSLFSHMLEYRLNKEQELSGEDRIILEKHICRLIGRVTVFDKSLLVALFTKLFFTKKMF